MLKNSVFSVVASSLLIFMYSRLVSEEKPITVVIPSYNNAQWYRRNLDSVCFQNYDTYRIIYIDDSSTDGTGDLVQAYIDEHQLHDKVTFICNTINCGAMANHYKAVWMCEDEEIVVHLDGDDWFKGNYVLARVNEAYQDPKVWLTYGQFEEYPYKKGFCRPMPAGIIQRNAFRECDWFTSHLRTFYAGLFKQIKLRDFVYKGTYFNATCDMAMMFPLLELAGKHIRYINDVLYVYNQETPLNDFKKRLLEQLHYDKVIRSRPKYLPAQHYMRPLESLIIDVVMFSHTPDQLAPILTDIEKQQRAINSVAILFDEQQQAAYDQVIAQFPQMQFVAYNKGSNQLSDFMHIICQHKGYILCTQDSLMITESLPLQEAVTALEQTKALSFHFSLGTDITRTRLLSREQRVPTFTRLPNGFYAWQFKLGEFDWRQPYNASMTLYRKADLKRMLHNTHYSDLQEFLSVLQLSAIDFDDMGLCCQKAVAQETKHIQQEIPSWAQQLARSGYTLQTHNDTKHRFTLVK